MLRVLSLDTVPELPECTQEGLWAFSNQKFGFVCLISHNKVWEGGDWVK